MARIFGIEVSRRAIVLSQVHNVVEIVTVEHVLALAAGKVA